MPRGELFLKLLQLFDPLFVTRNSGFVIGRDRKRVRGDILLPGCGRWCGGGDLASRFRPSPCAVVETTCTGFSLAWRCDRGFGGGRKSMVLLS